MKGSTKIVNRLNELLSGELTAADQYFIHSRMYEDWGLGVLSERIKHESEEELEHADALIKRILFLDGTPDLSVRAGLKIGSTAAEMMANDLELAISAARGRRARRARAAHFVFLLIGLAPRARARHAAFKK